MTQNVSDTCNAAADLIQRWGWTRGSTGWGREAHAPVCLEGALVLVSGVASWTDLEDHSPAYHAIKQYLGVVGPLWLWSDVQACRFISDNPHDPGSPEAHEWGKQQVIAVLRAVAVIHAAREDAEAGVVEAVPSAQVAS